MDTPVRRPVIRAVSFDDVAAALARLIPIALPPTRAAETGASPKVADFLLAWWNGGDNGHFPVVHLCNLDETIAEDMLTILAYLAQNPVIYADQWGYRDTMAEIYIPVSGRITSPAPAGRVTPDIWGAAAPASGLRRGAAPWW